MSDIEPGRRLSVAAVQALAEELALRILVRETANLAARVNAYEHGHDEHLRDEMMFLP